MRYIFVSIVAYILIVSNVFAAQLKNSFVDGTLGVGTTTPITTVQVIGTVTATGFSGNGSQLTGISSGEVGSWTSAGGLLYPKTISDNVGVGTNTPATKLHVVGTVTATGAYISNNISIGTTNLGKELSVISSALFPTAWLGESTTIGGVMEWNSADNIMSLKTVDHSYPITFGNDWIRIATDGKVGVGTTTPVTKLHVIGTVTATAATIGGVVSVLAQDGSAFIDTITNPNINVGTGIVSYDGIETIVTYNGTGTTSFTPPTGVTNVRVLVVAGGGGGGVGVGGGGGGGGVIGSSSVSITGLVTVTVGTGGPGRSTDGAGTAGSSSVFGSITATGGGGGGGWNGTATSGGSGGGGNTGNGATYITAGTGIAGQGNNGGTGLATLPAGAAGGGGGGAGGVGAAGGNAPTNGVGGVGVSNNISGSTIFYGGGGGGGLYTAGATTTARLGGNGGGGAGNGTSTASVAGTIRTGGGGGGNQGSSSAAGGSGIVIIRFVTSYDMLSVNDKLRLDASGRLSIGTTTANNSLTVANNGVNGVGIDLRSDDTDLANINNFSAARLFADFGSTSYADSRLYLQTATGDNTWKTGLTIKDGKVGIETGTPTTTLHVVGTVTATGFVGNGSGFTGISHNIITGTGTNSHATIDSHLASSSNPHGATLTQTNISVTTGTVTTLYNTTFSGSVGTFTATLGVNGISGITDSDIPNTITLDNITQITNRAHDSITGTGTNSHATLDTHLADTSDPHGATLTQTAATIAGIAAPYIAQTNGTGTGVTLAGNSNFPSGIWNSSGNAGIGTSTPQVGLHVVNNTVPVSTAAMPAVFDATAYSFPLVRALNQAGILFLAKSFATSWGIGMNEQIGAAGSGFGIFSIPKTGDFPNVDGRTNRFVITTDGNVGIGTTTPATLLDVSGAATIRSTLTLGNTGLADAVLNSDGSLYVNFDANNDETGKVLEIGTNRTGGGGGTSIMVLQDNGSVGIGTAPSAQLHTTGSVRFATLGAGAVQSDANGNLSVSSDERLKIVQGTFTSNLEAILGIEPVLYKYNELSGLDQENTYVGFLAQNVMQYIPEAVGKDSAGYYTFNDRPVIAALVNSVKELQKEIEELQKVNSIALKGYKATAITDKIRVIKTSAIRLEKAEIKQGEETHEYVEEGVEDNFLEVASVSAWENVTKYEERKIPYDDIISEWELQGTSTVQIQKIVSKFRTEKIPTGTETVLKQGIAFNKQNGKFYQKIQVPKMINKMKSGYEFRKEDGKFYRDETLEEAKARRIANGID